MDSAAAEAASASQGNVYSQRTESNTDTNTNADQLQPQAHMNAHADSSCSCSCSPTDSPTPSALTLATATGLTSSRSSLLLLSHPFLSSAASSLTIDQRGFIVELTENQSWNMPQTIKRMKVSNQTQKQNENENDDPSNPTITPAAAPSSSSAPVPVPSKSPSSAPIPVPIPVPFPIPSPATSSDSVSVLTVSGSFTSSFRRYSELLFPMKFLCPNSIGLSLPREFSLESVCACLTALGRTVPVIDSDSQIDNLTYSPSAWLEYFRSAPTSRSAVLNSLSLEISDLDIAKSIRPPQFSLSEDWNSLLDWADYSPSNATPPSHRLYCLMSSAGSFTDFHFDFGGSSVWYHVARGEKIFFLIPNKIEFVREYCSWYQQPDRSHQAGRSLIDRLPPNSVGKISVKAGETLFLPSGFIHSVFTPVDSLVLGGNFLSTPAIPTQLFVSNLERLTSVHPRYRMPAFRAANWLIIRLVNQKLRDAEEEKANSMFEPFELRHLLLLCSAARLWLCSSRPSVWRGFVRSSVDSKKIKFASDIVVQKPMELLNELQSRIIIITGNNNGTELHPTIKARAEEIIRRTEKLHYSVIKERILNEETQFNQIDQRRIDEFAVKSIFGRRKFRQEMQDEEDKNMESELQQANTASERQSDGESFSSFDSSDFEEEEEAGQAMRENHRKKQKNEKIQAKQKETNSNQRPPSQSQKQSQIHPHPQLQLPTKSSIQHNRLSSKQRLMKKMGLKAKDVRRI